MNRLHIGSHLCLTVRPAANGLRSNSGQLHLCQTCRVLGSFCCGMLAEAIRIRCDSFLCAPPSTWLSSPEAVSHRCLLRRSTSGWQPALPWLQLLREWLLAKRRKKRATILPDGATDEDLIGELACAHHLVAAQRLSRTFD